MSQDRKDGHPQHPQHPMEVCKKYAGHIKEPRAALIELLTQYLNQPKVSELNKGTLLDTMLTNLKEYSHHYFYDTFEYLAHLAATEPYSSQRLPLMLPAIIQYMKTSHNIRPSNVPFIEEENPAFQAAKKAQSISDNTGIMMMLEEVSQFQQPQLLSTVVLQSMEREYITGLIAANAVNRQLSETIILDDFNQIKKLVSLMPDISEAFRMNKTLITQRCNVTLQREAKEPKLPNLEKQFTEIGSLFKGTLADWLSDRAYHKKAETLIPIFDSAITFLLLMGKTEKEKISKEKILKIAESLMRSPEQPGLEMGRFLQDLLILNNVYQAFDNKDFNNLLRKIFIDIFSKYTKDQRFSFNPQDIEILKQFETFINPTRLLADYKWDFVDFVNSPGFERDTALLVATKKFSPPAVNWLFDHMQADPNAAGSDGNTPLLVLAQDRKMGLYNMPGVFGALGRDYVAVLEILLSQKNLNLTYQNPQTGDTALLAAMKADNELVVESLVKRIPEAKGGYELLTIPDNDGFTPLTLAQSNPKKYKQELKSILKLYTGYDPLAIKNAHRDTLQFILDEYDNQYKQVGNKKSPNIIAEAIETLNEDEPESFSKAFDLLERTALVFDKGPVGKWSLKEIVDFMKEVYPQQTKTLTKEQKAVSRKAAEKSPGTLSLLEERKKSGPPAAGKQSAATETPHTATETPHAATEPAAPTAGDDWQEETTAAESEDWSADPGKEDDWGVGAEGWEGDEQPSEQPTTPKGKK